MARKFTALFYHQSGIRGRKLLGQNRSHSVEQRSLAGGILSELLDHHAAIAAAHGVFGFTANGRGAVEMKTFDRVGIRLWFELRD